MSYDFKDNIDTSIKKALKKAPQFTRLKRHLLSVLTHSTPKKIANLLSIELQRKLHSTKVKGYPYILILDSGNICNLNCPLCPSGRKDINRKKEFLTYDNFKQIVDNLAHYLFEVALHNWGEPFLNPDIFRMIKYCNDNNLGTNLSSNFNLPDLDIDQVVNSGLEYMIASLDATTQDVYSQYRVGGNIDMVYDNLAKIVQKKKELNSKTPFIEWQYIVMKHNCHQIEPALKKAKEIGVDLIRFIPVGLPFDAEDKVQLEQKWFPSLPDNDSSVNNRILQKPIKGGCFYLYRSVTVNPDGSVLPCCVLYDEKDDFANIYQQDFMDIWNNNLYQSARSIFSPGKKSSIKTACHRCNMFSH